MYLYDAGGLPEGARVTLKPNTMYTWKENDSITSAQLQTMHSTGAFRKTFGKTLKINIRSFQHVQVIA